MPGRGTRNGRASRRRAVEIESRSARLVRLWHRVLQAPELREARAVERRHIRPAAFDEVPRRIADVHLDASVGQLVQRLEERVALEDVELLHTPIRLVEVVDVDPDVVELRRLSVALEE